jgi:hypothetical protein
MLAGWILLGCAVLILVVLAFEPWHRKEKHTKNVEQ